jgi:hypothetical protein
MRALSDTDSLVFGSIEADDVTGDESGLELLFEFVGDSVRGSFRRAAGETTQPYAIDGLRLGRVADSISFWYTTGGRNIYYVRARLSCDSLWGTRRHRVLPDYRDTINSDGKATPFSLPRLTKQFQSPR